MKESHDERLATSIGPESGGATRKGGVEALTGERAGQVLSRERSQTPGRRRCYLKRKATPLAPTTRGARGVPRGRRPCARTGTGRSRVLPRQNYAPGRVGKSKDARR